MTPHSLAFHGDVVTTGTALGAGPADSPARVAEILGPAFAEDTFGDHGMCRDYGLTEFYWDRTRTDDTLRTRYGRFARGLRFEKLHRLLVRRGVHLTEVPAIPAAAPHFRTF
ncbi:hypothetical protein [Streptomyces sp. VNUA24]|uniref:hypothetical protein n=1 Tax=Streptomyces sp. VNUA24 TaxID=3031131 RepID=UPI0023B78106|nr:hypothetical protein [Streptomyces sp. VNUA24]WEH13319.1 hypothetical protein PYR72_06250 [Streptomyces sp. VNUA24]